MKDPLNLTGIVEMRMCHKKALCELFGLGDLVERVFESIINNQVSHNL
jgi:hypothetical protein